MSSPFNTIRGRSVAQTVLGTLIGVSAGWTVTASAQGRLSADASLSAGVATNPYQQAGDTPTAASVTLQLSPEYSIDTDLTKLRVQGDVRVTEYSAGYRANDSYSLRGSGEHRISPSTQLNAEIAYVNSVVGSFNDVVGSFSNPVVPSAGSVPIDQSPTFVNDPALAGIGQRRSALSILGGATVALSSFDQIAGRITSAVTRYSNDDIGLDEFNNVAAGLSYQRTVSDKFTVGGNADVSRVNYRDGRLGDATIYQPSISVTRIIDARWTLTASAGAAVVRISELNGSRSSTEFNGSLTACRRDIRWNSCLTASRSSLPSSVQGVRTQTGISASFGYRVTETDDLTLAASYSRASSPLLRGTPGLPVATIGAVDFVSANASYTKQFAPRLSAFVSAGVAKSDDDLINRNANIEGRLGVRYRLGERR